MCTAWMSLGLAATLLVTGCADARYVSVKHGSRDAAREARFAGDAPKDRYLKVQSKKQDKPGRMAMVIPCDLWGPFRWEVSAGLFDPDKAAAADQSIFGTELDGRGAFPPTEFYGISAQVTNGGLNVFAYTHNSPSAIGSQFFAGAGEVTFAIESTGAQLLFQARPRGEKTFTQVATFPFANQQDPLLPSIGVFNLANKGVVGFDEWRLVASSDEPGTPPAGRVASRRIWLAACALAEAGHALDGEPDFSGAATFLLAARNELDAARAQADQLATGGKVKKARKDLKKAAADLEQALALATAEKKEAKAIAAIESALERLFKASRRVYEATAP